MYVDQVQTSCRAFPQNNILLAFACRVFVASDAIDSPHQSCLRSYRRLWRGSAHRLFAAGYLLYAVLGSPRRNSLMNTKVNVYELTAQRCSVVTQKIDCACEVSCSNAIYRVVFSHL